MNTTILAAQPRTHRFGEPITAPTTYQLFVRQKQALQRLATARDTTVIFLLRELVDEWLRANDTDRGDGDVRTSP